MKVEIATKMSLKLIFDEDVVPIDSNTICFVIKNLVDVSAYAKSLGSMLVSFFLLILHIVHRRRMVSRLNSKFVFFFQFQLLIFRPISKSVFVKSINIKHI